MHSDVCAIGMSTILGEFTMFVQFVDDATRYMTIYLLRSKTNVGSAFIDYDTKVLNMTTRHVTTLRSEGGTEYFRSSIATYCAKHGIHQQSSTPYTPQHNSRAERPNYC